MNVKIIEEESEIEWNVEIELRSDWKYFNSKCCQKVFRGCVPVHG